MLIALGLNLGVAPATAHISTARCTSIYIDAKGPVNGADGTLARPFATPDAALERLRKQREKRPDGSFCLIFADGLYRLGRPLKIDAATTRTGTTRLIAAGKNVVFSGAVPLSVRTDVAGQRWTMDGANSCPQSRQHAIFINGARHGRSRLPKVGFFHVAGERPRQTDNGVAYDGFVFGADLTPSAAMITPTSEVIGFHFWSSSRLPVRSVDRQKAVILLDGLTSHTDAWARFATGEQYYLENVDTGDLSLGEWLQNEKGLFYAPKAEDRKALDSGAFVASLPCTPVLLTITDGARNIAVEGITFENTGDSDPPERLTPAQAGIGPHLTAAIMIDNAQDVRLHQVTLAHTAAFAILVTPRAGCVEISDSDLLDLGAGGVAIGDPETAYRQTKSSNDSFCGVRLLHNRIIDAGLLQAGAAGIWIGDVGHNQVIGNTINRVRYTGISIGWNWGGSGKSPDNIIQDNDISDIGMGVLSDLGAIYTLADLQGTKIVHNQIKGVKAAQYGGYGIYLDRDTAGVAVSGNVIRDVSHAGIGFHMTKRNQVRDNNICSGTVAAVTVIKPGPEANDIGGNKCN